MARPDPLVIDASVAVKWVLRESDSDRALDVARRAADGALEPWAPDHWPSECGNTVWKRVRSDLTRQEGEDAIRLLLAAPVRLADGRRLLHRAFALALDSHATVCDTLYVALAEVLDTRVVTADRGFVRRCGTIGGTRRVVLLTDL